MASHHLVAEPSPSTHCLRVEITFDGDTARVTNVQRVAMRAPASAPEAPVEGQTGMWFEMRDADDRVLYHRPLRSTRLDSVEVFDDEETGGIRRVPVDRKQAKFDLIVPDLAAAGHVMLYGARDTAKRRQPSERLLQVEMSTLREHRNDEPE